MLKIGIAGAAGKIGRALVRAVHEHPELTLTSAWEQAGNPQVGQDAGWLAGIESLGVIVQDSAAGGLKNCELAMDFTAPAATLSLVALAQAARQSLVIGTTGLSASEQQVLRSAGNKIGIVYATNFSVGVNLLWRLAQQAAGILGETFDSEIIEYHHKLKKDSPSGTAWTLLEAICQGKSLDPKTSVRHGREGMVGIRSQSEIGMHAVRAGDIVGDHIALFAGPGERLELKHQAHSRDIFARGAARAAAWLAKQAPGYYQMADVLGMR